MNKELLRAYAINVWTAFLGLNMFREAILHNSVEFQLGGVVFIAFGFTCLGIVAKEHYDEFAGASPKGEPI